MNRLEKNQLSRRERQILDIIYRLGEATAQDVQDNLPDPPSYSAVRALLVTLENKGMLKHTKSGRRYLYHPAISEDSAKRSAIKNLLSTFFQGKPENLVASLLDPKDQKLSDEEIENIRSLIDDKQGE
ncbi:MAG: BlaI/MecI/CopY family transcriptional regulator [Verrucomicrobiota bacterium JB023]|nr:BlaI/MecI/CopY family transcriptional regulator [Verrucomicrobiota bacterium JB023]